MQHRIPSPCSVRFFEWLDNLSDQEHHEVLLELRAAAKELGCLVDRHTTVAEELFDLPPHSPSVGSLN